MEKFSSLKKLYEFLEANAETFEYRNDISSLFQKMRDFYSKKNKLSLVKKAQLEIHIFSFILDHGKLDPMFQSVDDKGIIQEYPSLKLFSEDDFKYLVSRFNKTGNSLLKAIYGNILWYSPLQHKNYGKTAIDSYLKLFFKHKDLGKDRNSIENAIQYLKRAYFVSKSLKYKLDEIKSLFFELINNYDIKDRHLSNILGVLIRFLLDEKKVFKPIEFISLVEICKTDGNYLFSIVDYHGAIYMFSLAEEIEKRNGKRNNIWQNMIGECNEKLITAEGKRGGLIAIHYCEKAIHNYKRAKNLVKINELQNQYHSLKNNLQLGVYSKKFDITKIVKYYNRVTDKLIKLNVDDLLFHISTTNHLFPNITAIEKAISKNKKMTPLQYLMPKGLYDRRGNTVQHFQDEENEYWAILQDYDFHMSVDKFYFIKILFGKLISTKKITADILSSFFKNNSWFGQEYIREFPNDHSVNVNWLGLIMPSIVEFFNTMYLFYLKPNVYNNFVMCIDSLTLKFEGLLRDLCEHLKINTVIFTVDQKGREIATEKDINMLLREEKLIELLGVDDIQFLKYVLVEKAGLNLRNNIAHCLMYVNEYSEIYMLLLIIGLLRLSRFKIRFN